MPYTHTHTNFLSFLFVHKMHCEERIGCRMLWYIYTPSSCETRRGSLRVNRAPVHHEAVQSSFPLLHRLGYFTFLGFQIIFKVYCFSDSSGRRTDWLWETYGLSLWRIIVCASISRGVQIHFLLFEFFYLCTRVGGWGYVIHLSNTQAPCHGLRGRRVTVSRDGASQGNSERSQEMSEIHASDMYTISRRCAIDALWKRFFTHLIALFMLYFFVRYIKKEVFIPHVFENTTIVTRGSHLF